MIIDTRIFGSIDIEEDKIIKFQNGIVGFPDMTEFTLIHNEETPDNAGVRWLQSIQEPTFAMPVIDPLSIIASYNPEVDDELIKPIGLMSSEEMLVLVTITVPSDIKKMSVNLRAPLIINAAERKACQIIAEGESYQVKFPIYEILEAAKKAGE